jgi:nitrogen fixation protein FixH
MTYHGWQEVIGVIGLFGLVIVVITIVIWHLAATWRARAILARDYEYRTLAEKAVKAQSATEQHLVDIDGRLTEMQNRMHSVERILKEIE